MLKSKSIVAAGRLPLSAVLLSFGCVLLLSGAAQAATVWQKAYTISIKEFHQQLAYSSAQMQSALTATQTKLASCATTIDDLSFTSPNAAEDFANELEDQYTADVAVGVDQPALSAFTALAKLPLLRTEHKQALADQTIMHRLLTLNTCGDLTRWQATGFSSSTEPPNTKQFGQVFSVELPSFSLSLTLPTSETKNYDKLIVKAGDKTSAVFTAIGDDWSTWSQGFNF